MTVMEPQTNALGSTDYYLDKIDGYGTGTAPAHVQNLPAMRSTARL